MTALTTHQVEARRAGISTSSVRPYSARGQRDNSPRWSPSTSASGIRLGRAHLLELDAVGDRGVPNFTKRPLGAASRHVMVHDLRGCESLAIELRAA